MCWSSKNKTLAECKKIARYNIPVRKLVDVSEKTGNIVSYFTNFIYKFGETYEGPSLLGLDEYDSQRWVNIAKGFHSYDPQCKLTAKDKTDDFGLMKNHTVKVYSPDEKEFIEYYDLRRLMLIDCVIPKGTIYCVNEVGEYVSERIKPIRFTDAEKEGINIPELWLSNVKNKLK